MRYRIDYKRLALLAVLVTVLILILRGCFAACTARVEPPEDAQDGENAIPEQIVLTLYDDDAHTTRRLMLEEYIIGVVAAEMPASFQPDALRAQAVAARTFTVRHIAALGGRACGREGCDICADSSCCQAWSGEEKLRKNWGDDYQTNRDKVQEAVYSTAGEIMTYAGEPIEALYHSTSGGYTEDSENVFSQARPYLRAVASPGEEDAPRFMREYELTARELADKLNAAFPRAKLNRRKLSEQVEITSRFESGRVESVRLNNVTVSGRELRGALELDSANFTISVSDTKVKITSLGFGHGVGMSQLGADAMARAGASYRDILLHYYTGVKISGIEL